MNLTIKRNTSLPSLLSDFFAPSSFLANDFFDFDKDLSPTRLGINVPTANITESAKEFRLELAAPGLQQKDFNVEIENNVLKISAEKEEEDVQRDGDYSRKEYSFNSFVRTFELPENIRQAGIDAKYENGVLKITIPKQQETQTRPVQKISVS